MPRKITVIENCRHCPHFERFNTCGHPRFWQFPGYKGIMDPNQIPDWCPLSDVQEDN